MAFGRYNGHSYENRIGYFYGANAFATIAIDGTAGANGGIIEFFASGVVPALAEFKRVHGLDAGNGNAGSGQDISVLAEEQRTFEGVKADGTKGTTAPLTNDLAYLKAYIAQENFKRLVDTVQQRAVIDATSEEVKIVDLTADLDFFNETANTAGAGAVLADAATITFLIERANVFNQDVTDVYGQPTGLVYEGKNLQEALNGISLLGVGTASGESKPVSIELAPSATAAEGNYGVKMVGIPGSKNIWKPVY